MGWGGYIEFDGNEVINSSRTEAYAKRFGLGWFKPRFKNPDLVTVLGDDPYDTPANDDAPWIDPRHPESAEFYGVYPLDITGIEDSTATAPVSESIDNGGTIGPGRLGTKSVVFNTILVAASEGGAEYGLQWLKRVLTADSCGSTTSCTGHDLCYFSHGPKIGPWIDPRICSDRLLTPPSDPEVVSHRLLRTLRGVQTTTGAQVISKRVTSDRGAVWNVSFTLTANNAVEFGQADDFLIGWLDPAVTSPWPGGVAPAGASTVDVPYTVPSDECFQPAYTPLYDPLAPAVVAPPQPAGIQWVTFDPPDTWDRRRAVIPASFIPAWTDVAPIISLTAQGEAIRNIRIRIYADPTNAGDMVDPCDFCADMVVSYLPVDATLVFDGRDRVVYADTTGGVRRRADSLVYTTNGTPFDWPELSCGNQHVLMVDVPVGITPPSVAVSFVERFA